MIKATSNKSSSNNLQFSIARNTSTNKVCSFLDTYLPLCLSDLTEGLTHEDDLSQELCIYLNREATLKNMFMFHFQYKYPGSNRSSDLSIISLERFSTKTPMYVIEAKRLPTPGGRGREREYVAGNLGGIERFKRGHHGGNLAASAMVGYIQAHDFKHWHDNINNWISELTADSSQTIKWELKEQLSFTKDFGEQAYKLMSMHEKADSSTIELTHYWLNLCPSTKQN